MFRKCVSIASALLILGSVALTASAEEVIYDKPADAKTYADFNTPFVDEPGFESTKVDSGEPGGTIQITALSGASTTAAVTDDAGNSVLKVEFKSSDADPYVRFQNSLSVMNGDDDMSSAQLAFQYMVIRLRGESADDVAVGGGPGAGALCISFGGAGNMNNALSFRADGYPGQATGATDPEGNALAAITEEYQTFIIKLEDKYFQGMGAPGDASQIFIKSIGNFNKTLYIDEIYFTNTVPPVHQDGGDDEGEGDTWTDNNTIPEDAIYIEDGRRDTYALPYGDTKINFANGEHTSFLNEVTPLGGGEFSIADGIVTWNVQAESEGVSNGVSMSLGENYYTNYKYIVFRIKATEGAGDKVGVKLGSNNATEILFNDLKFSADQYVKELSGEWQDIYVSTDAALNGLNNQPYLKLLGRGDATVEIDCIYMTNTVPEGYEAGPAVSTGDEEPDQQPGDTDDTVDNTDTGVALPVGVAAMAVVSAGALVITRRRKGGK